MRLLLFAVGLGLLPVRGQAGVADELMKAANAQAARQKKSPALIMEQLGPVIDALPKPLPEKPTPEQLEQYRSGLVRALEQVKGDRNLHELVVTVIDQAMPPSDYAPPPAAAPGRPQPTDATRAKPAKPSRPPEGDPPYEIAKARRRVSPEDPRAQRNWGDMNLNLGRFRDAAEGYGAAIEAGDERSETYSKYARAAYHAGDPELAIEAARRALEIDPRNAEADAIIKLAAGRVSSVNIPSALGRAGLGAARSATQAQSAQAPGLGPVGVADGGAAGGGVYAGDARSGMSAAQIAAAAAKQAQAPKSLIEQSKALNRTIIEALRVDDNERAYNLASEAIKLNPQNGQAWVYRATVNNRLRRFPDAVYDSSFALGLSQGNAAALQNRSWAFSKQGLYQEGLEDAMATLEVNPESPDAHYNRSFALAGLKDRSGSLQALRRAAQLSPRFHGKLEDALVAAEDADLLFLFGDQPAPRAAAPAPPGQRRRRTFRLLLLSLSGGALVALGLLHIVSASWREKVRATIRRVLAPAGELGAAPAELPGAPAGVGFWALYKLIREIGSGGMGIVYEAHDTSLQRAVAVKKMRDEIRRDPVERQRFVTEARTVAGLHHPNIVDIYSIVEEEADVYLVFEFVHGRTLHEMLRDDGPLPFEKARRILKGACDAVAHAHAHKVIHRDLKPSNIMVTEAGSVKVMDFGVARQAKDAVTKMSLTNTIVGTPPYMAPEQEQGTVRRESDVFALGVVFYEMLSAELPFTGVGAGMLLNKINARQVPLSKAAAQPLPKGIDELIAKALAPDPEQRFRSPAELLAAVEALALPAAG